MAPASRPLMDEPITIPAISPETSGDETSAERPSKAPRTTPTMRPVTGRLSMFSPSPFHSTSAANPFCRIARMSTFPTTRWSALVGARSDDSGERQRSWTTLVSAYWKPAYKHVRIRWPRSREDAEDILQGFVERAMRKDFFARYDPDKARFRTFFRTCLDRWVSNEAKAAAR